MQRLSLSEKITLIIALATVGGLLVYLPPRLLDQYHQIKDLGPPWTYFYFATVGLGAVILLGLAGGMVWKLWSATRRKAAAKARRQQNPSELSPAEKEKEVAENLASVEQYQADASVDDDLKRQLQALTSRVEQKQDSQRLEIVAFGSISSGKSSLLNALAGRDLFQTDLRGGTTLQRQEIPWPGDAQVLLVDTPGLGEVAGEERLAVAAEAARDADAVLLVVDGPLRDSEARLLRRLGEMEKRVLICINKADWYSEQDRGLLAGQLAEQLQGVVPAGDVLSVRSQATERTRVRVLSSGEEAEEQITVPPDIGPLATRLLSVVRREGKELLLANLLLQSRGLVDEAKNKVKEALDRKAWEIVDRYTWGAGAAAAVSPMVIDLIVGSGITAKMLVDLARVYKQELDLNAAMKLLAQLGKNLVAILGVNAAAPAIASGIAGLLKTIPLAGTIAGGALQGVVQALVTRWIGGVFIEYYRSEMTQADEGLANLARREWQRLTAPAELLKFIQTAREKLTSTTPPPSP